MIVTGDLMDRLTLDKRLSGCKAALPLSDDLSVLEKPLTINLKNIHNRLAVQPMEGCDGTADGRPDTLTKRRYDRFARGGAGLIWFEATAILNEGRANPRQLFLNENTLDSFKQIVCDIKETGLKENGFEPLVICQLTHSGRYSKPEGVPAPLIAYNNPLFEKDKPIDKDRIVSDGYLKSLEDSFGYAAALAERAGFDGADIKCCHRYLLCELLSAFERKGDYGGSFENRTRLYLNALKSAAASTSRDFIITSRLNIYDGFPYPYGFGVETDGSLSPDTSEPERLVNILYNELKIKLLNITIGNPYVNPHVNRPFDSGPYTPPEEPLFGVARMMNLTERVHKSAPDLTVIASGFSYLRESAPFLAAGAVKSGVCEMAGFGREAFAYPDFARDIIGKGVMNPKKCCIACGKCSELMRAGAVAGCAVRDKEVYMPIYREKVMKNA